MNSGNLIDKQKLESALETVKFGRSLKILDTVGSTNDVADGDARVGKKEGHVVAARRQSGGVGRFGRKWLSPLGGLWFSIILDPPPKEPAAMTVILGGCVSSVLEEKIGAEFGFHWPNDVFYKNKKVGGILVRTKCIGSKPDYVIAGVGLNCNFSRSALSSALLQPATTLLDVLGEEINLNTLLADILSRMEKDWFRFINNGPGVLIKRYKPRCTTIGRNVQIESKEGRLRKALAVDVIENGGLVIQNESGSREILYNVHRLKIT